MSRICVKNLPKYVKEDRLLEHFSRKGEITDAKIMRNKDGKSRQFAFIGFRTQGEAEEAIKYFNKSYLDTCRIVCELAHKVGDPGIPRPWSRYSANAKNEETKDSNDTESAGARKSRNEFATRDRKKTTKEEMSEDSQFREFLQVMQPRVKSKLWADNTMISPSADVKSVEVKEKEVRANNGAEKSRTVDVEINDSNDSLKKKSQNLARNEGITDMDYFKSKVKKEWSDSESDNDNIDKDNDDVDADKGNNDDRLERADHLNSNNDEDHEANYDDGDKADDMDAQDADLEQQYGRTAVEEDPLESSDTDNDRLYVWNLPYSATEDELEELFGKFGSISQVHIVVDKGTMRSKGIAYIRYALPESSTRALEQLDNSTFQGRLLHVLHAKQNKSSEKQETNLSTGHASKTFKQRREEEKKASEASGNTRSWNSLFMRPDTVAENIARKLGVSKSDLLDREGDDLAVRLALGETQVIAETKKALANAGVNVSSLEDYAARNTDGMKRSNHVLLVKNLPYGSSEGELANMFGKFGSLHKVILPATKTLAVVVFLEPTEARAALKGLAYKRYKDSPLYLEWAPDNILSQSSASVSDDVGGDVAKRMMLEQDVQGISDVDVDPDRVESRSLFVKNLNFKTSDESLKEHVTVNMKNGKILSVKVKKHMKNGKNVSMGFGFIELDTVETAANVCRDLQGTVLDGHALILQVCNAKKDEQVGKRVDKDKSLTKLLVKNVAFQATEKDLRQLFSSFGQIKSVRLPSKFGNHRGFAFVEFVTKQEAQTAIQALANTHLYGRHLVLERAKEGESLEELRARTAAQFTDEQSGFQNTAKLSKKRKHMSVVDEASIKFERIAD